MPARRARGAAAVDHRTGRGAVAVDPVGPAGHEGDAIDTGDAPGHGSRQMLVATTAADSPGKAYGGLPRQDERRPATAGEPDKAIGDPSRRSTDVAFEPLEWRIHHRVAVLRQPGTRRLVPRIHPDHDFDAAVAHRTAVRLRRRLEPPAHRNGNTWPKAVALEHGYRFGGRSRRPHGRPRADHRRIVADHVGYDQRPYHRRICGTRQTAVLDLGERAAHEVHLFDRRAAAEQQSIHANDIVVVETGTWNFEQRGRTARNQVKQAVAAPQRRNGVENPP